MWNSEAGEIEGQRLTYIGWATQKLDKGPATSQTSQLYHQFWRTWNKSKRARCTRERGGERVLFNASEAPVWAYGRRYWERVNPFKEQHGGQSTGQVYLYRPAVAMLSMVLYKVKITGVAIINPTPPTSIQNSPPLYSSSCNPRLLAVEITLSQVRIRQKQILVPSGVPHFRSVRSSLALAQLKSCAHT